MRNLGLLSMLTICLTACSDPINVGDEASVLSQNEISAQSVSWTTTRAGGGYTMEVYRTSYVIRPADWFPNYRVSVDASNNKILLEAIDENGVALLTPTDSPGYYPTMEEILNMAFDEISNGMIVSGQFDADESYPTSLNFGNDEFYTITVTGYF